MILKAFNKLWSTSYSWEEYVAVLSGVCKRGRACLFAGGNIGQQRKKSCSNSIKYLRLWKEYFKQQKSV